MAYEVSWHLQDRVVFAKISGDFSLDDLHDSSSAISNDFLEVGAEPVHLICDVSGITRFPTQIMAIKQNTDLYLKHRKMGWLVMIGFNNPLAKFLANTISQTGRINFQQANSLEEAYTLLRRVDLTLRDLE